jgi:hypothetical protein
MILPTDSVCWHCGKELKPAKTTINATPETDDTAVTTESIPISLTAVSIFALISLITILLFILVTTILAG